jgi:formate hydrogenlyase subunit 3/multisubunit Na+/H+ antiporter MnhD subunit
LLSYVSLLLPLAGAAMLFAAAGRGRVTREEAAVVGALVIVCAVIEVALVRGSPESRAAGRCRADVSPRRLGHGAVDPS